MLAFERPSAYGGCTLKPVANAAISWSAVRLLMAKSVSPAPRQTAAI
jgi:hypothetical protein